MSNAGEVIVVVGVLALILVGITIGSIYLNQCTFGCGDSMRVRVQSIGLLTHPTDNVLFGWEWLFGRPADEIVIMLGSGWCNTKSDQEHSLKEGEIIRYPDVGINTFYQKGFSFRLEEKDSGLEGRDDYSKFVHVSDEKMANIRETFDNGLAEHINLDFLVTVKGQNIFQEQRWFGFLAENLCISAMDFLTGPFTSKLFKFGSKLIFNARDIAKLYNVVKIQYKSGQLTKKSIFKSLIIYQIREGLKDGFLGPIKSHLLEFIKDLALNQTHLEEQIKAIVNGDLGTYGQLYNELDTRASFVGSLTDKLEFCLSDILPPSRDALYYVNFAVTR